MLFFCHFEAIRAPPNGPKMVDKNPQVISMYNLMTKLKNESLAKLLGPFFLEKWSKTTRKQVFMLFLVILEPFGHPQTDSKRYAKAKKWARCMGQCLT
jgi:hypothetical protein